MNISYKIGNGTFNYRTCGVLLHDNKVLVVTEEHLDFCYFPGGRVQIFESSTLALAREISEELGVAPTIERLLWVAESMFYLSAWDRNVHELCFYYSIHLPQNSELYKKQSFVTHGVIDGQKTTLNFTWVDIGTLGKKNLKPEFLQNKLQALPEFPEHVIINELGLGTTKTK